MLTTVSEYIDHRLKGRTSSTPFLVAIDGIDCAGKTTFSSSLAGSLAARRHHVVRASIDGFHNPREIRIQQGKLSPQGFYRDSFDYDYLIEQVLKPIKELTQPNSVPLAKFDWRSDQEVSSGSVEVSPDSTIIFEGVFLFRPELISFWDFKIFLHIPFEVSLERGLQRDAEQLGGVEKTREKYMKRYIPGQKIYLREAEPMRHADLIFDNSEPQNPVQIEKVNV